MENRWRDDGAAACIARYADEHGEDLALRLYTSRLIGAERGLVLHGGGNTSLKGTRTDLLGEPAAALFIKASGHDLADLEPEGLVAVELAGLGRLRALDALSDRAMTAELRRNLFDPGAATPSVETLVHAFLPDRFIDHSHADAVLALTNQSGGAAVVSRALGPEVVVIPYVAPGFALSKAVAAAREARPEARAMVWVQHGIMTWGETGR
ncbi:MAG: class II aldolase/adducin family protein, partial [Alphaproteobacteria bacterium]|nr:class II aldolase/adducin family protein [Alphaproteobacteria bacterium]